MQRITVWVQRFADRPHLMLQWLDPETGRRKSKSSKTADPTEAAGKAADLEYELSHGRYQDAASMTWQRFRELFEAEYVAGKRVNTRENYTATLDLFERLCNPRQLGKVTERTLSRFVAEMRQVKVRGRVGMMPATILNRLHLVRAALQWAADQKLIVAVPKLPSVKVPKRRPQPIATESFEKLLDKAPNVEMRTYLLCGWLAGLRLSEAAALEWEPSSDVPYVDLGRNRIILPATFAKADEDQWVPLDPALRKALEALPRHGRAVFRFEARDGHTVCSTAIGERVIRLAKKAGVKLTMHSLRKGFGCRYASKVPAQVLQRLMRHSNIATTMGFYANVDDAVEEAILGPRQRNGSRNKSASASADADDADAETLNEQQD